MSRRDDDLPMAVRVPANVDRPDRIAFGLTGRQLALAGTVAAGLWLLYQATRAVVPFLVFAIICLPVVGVTAAVLLIRRDGLGLDELLLAALRQRRAPRRLVPAETVSGETVPAAPTWVATSSGTLPAPLRLPAAAISAEGAIDLGADGVAAQCACSGVNFGLRTPGEQRALVTGFARWLHSLTGPVQIVVRADVLDLDPIITALDESAAALPHPALEDACRAHAEFLHQLSASSDLLRRQILLVITEPQRSGKAGRATAGQLVLRRAAEAARALGAAEVRVSLLDGAQAETVLATAADPHGAPTSRRAATRSTGLVTGSLELHPTPTDGR